MTTEPQDTPVNPPIYPPHDSNPAEPPVNAGRLAENCTDPMICAAYSLLELEAPSQGLDTAQVETILEHQAERIRQNDFTGIEKILAAQTQVLHMIFAQAVGKYADANEKNNHQGYGTLALKAQNYCRMTIDAIIRLKSNSRRLDAKNEKIEEPAIKNGPEMTEMKDPAIMEGSL